MILDYSTFVQDEQRLGIGGNKPPDNLSLFFGRRAWCPFCKINTPMVYQSHIHPKSDAIDSPGYTLNHVWSCPCGWWELEHTRGDDSTYRKVLRHAILRSFQPSDLMLPIEALRRCLTDQPSLVYEIHPQKMEQLVQSVFREYFHCDVYHCGRSHDGGVDLYFVQGENSVVVQVKRRSNPNATESVGTVRDLLGATKLHPGQHSILVTTAKRFSREAKAAAARAIRLKAVKSYELIEASRFFEMLNLVHSGIGELWRSHLL